ncbi:kinesin-like protein KIN-5C [Aristolochia californica]|uniref:kinesin-like protein KIN-5C n=1 Tax=Aristolochia californica TaxID=171875 RepID=UPI0035E02540
MACRQEREKGVNVQVLLRCRPFSEEELRNNAPQVVTCNDYQREVAVTQSIAGKQMDRVFTFDKVFGPSAQQKDLYQQAIVPIVNEVLEGFNCTIFAYGQTGTGKTYTMEGECKKAKSGPTGKLPLDAGVIPRAVKQIFDTLESQNAEYSVKVTFLELYNEEITDLLAPEELSKVALEEKLKKPLLLMEDGKGGVLVRGLEEEIVSSANEIFTLLERGSAKRRTAETLLNKQSSRSHSLFTITIHIKEATPEGEELIKCGKLNLVDLAGSENISRSGAREGRAREAGEINKSLLTLGRVITALVEHLGHIPYRDSKLTRLLRDSLGGRTKTCIIATVSPSVHCLEETLSTLDYAHRAKNIKNKPEVNQKMMKTTLIKDLYGEIDRLKAEVYAAREKNGVYIPKERYHQEESERKAMADQIEQMTGLLETNQKQIEDLQAKYDTEVLLSSCLSSKLESTEQNLEETHKLLAEANDNLKKSRYTLKEKEFIISEQKKAENALIQQACTLRADLEKSVQDNASLFHKIDREDKLNAENRSVVNDFHLALSEHIGTLCSTVAVAITKQKEYLQCVEELCRSCLHFHDMSVKELKEKVAASRSLYLSHVEGIQNVVRLHQATSNANLEELANLASINHHCLEEFLAAELGEADSIFTALRGTLLNQQGEIASFAQELCERFDADSKHIKETSEYIVGLLDTLREETQKFQSYASCAHEDQITAIGDFELAYEEQSRSEAEKLLVDMTSLLSGHLVRQKELVDMRLGQLRGAAIQSKTFVDEHSFKMNNITCDAKRKWHTFSSQAENRAEECRVFMAAKHCCMEGLLQQSVGIADNACKHFKKTSEAINEMGSRHVLAMDSCVRTTIDANVQHDLEISSARDVAEADTAKNSDDMLQHFGRVSEHEWQLNSGIVEAVGAHSNTLEKLQEDHAAKVIDIEQHTRNTLQHRYMDYEPSGSTPTRCDTDVPSKVTIESLRAMPMEVLLEEFRENHPYPSATKESKLSPSLIPRLPLSHLN